MTVMYEVPELVEIDRALNVIQDGTGSQELEEEPKFDLYDPTVLDAD